MKKSLQINFENQTSMPFEALFVKSNSTFLNVENNFDISAPLYLELSHSKLNTLLELTRVSPIVILSFDDSFKFSSATFSLNPSDSTYCVTTQSKRFLLLPYPIAFHLEQVLSLTLIS
jgi:hypothetical protein